MNIQKYLLHSTLICLFSGAFFIEAGFVIKFFYFIILINSLLIFKYSSYFINKFFGYILLIISCFGLVSILFFDNQLIRVIFQIVGIFIVANYFYNFYRITKYSIEELFIKYCQYAYFISIVGLAFFFFQFLTGISPIKVLHSILPFGYPNNENPPLKVQSILLEPSHFAGIVLPAFLYYLYNYKSEKIKFLTIFFALILSFSSVGYLGILIGFLLAYNSSLYKKIAGIIIASIIGLFSYTYIEDINIRVNDTLKVIVNGDYNFEGTNLSTYALLSNFYVTTQVLKDSPLIGHGIGSHPISHQKYIGGVESGDAIEILGATEMNKEDANSLLLRILSELGIIGLLFTFLFVIRNYTKDNHQISNAILLYFFYKLLREGHYFSPEMYFFVFLYINLHKDQLIRTFQAKVAVKN